MASYRNARSLYLQLLVAAESPSDKLEMAAAIARAMHSRITRGRGALHVRRPIVVRLDGLRYSVPVRDNSFASGEPGEANSPVVPELIRLIEQRPQPVYLDIGANLGLVCMTIAQRFPAKRVVAVEPIPWLAEALERTAALNGFSQLTVVPRAIAGIAELELSVPVMDGVYFTTLSSGLDSASAQAPTAERAHFRVPGVGLDALLQELGIPPADLACVKIDVEGAEALALATGRKALSAERPPVVFEALTASFRAEVEELLTACGYRNFRAVDAQNFVATA